VRTRLALAVCALLAVAIVVGLVTADDGGQRSGHAPTATQPSSGAGGPRAGTQPPAITAPARRFLDSIGVVMHLNYVDTAYGRQPEVLDRLRELGVRHIREGLPFRAPALARGLRAAASLGVSATLVTDLKTPPGAGVASALRVLGRHVDAFEGPNELDQSGPPDWRRQLARYLPALRAAVDRRRPGEPLVGPSFVDLSNYRTLARSTFTLASIHPYPGGLPPEAPLSAEIPNARNVVDGRQVEVTEIGYHNALAARTGQPPVSERAAATYLPRALLWSFVLGAKRTFVYELLDEKPDPALIDPEQHFGLLRSDLSRKPAFDAIRNLIAAIGRSPGPAADRPPAPSVRSRDHVESVVLTRRDGSRILALWRPVTVWDLNRQRAVDPGMKPVEVAWPVAAHDVTVTRPARGADPVSRAPSSRRMQLELGGNVVLLSYR
jgi:hypothetical protein